MMTREEFCKIWKDSSKKDILYQYYFDYLELLFYRNLLHGKGDK